MSVLEETTVWGKMLVRCVCVAFLMLRALQHAYSRKRQVFIPAPLFTPC